MFCQNRYQCSLKEDNKGQLFMLIHKTWCQILKVIVQLLSCVRLFMMSWSVACQAPLSSPVSWNLLKLMSTESMMLSNHPLPPSSFALFISNIRVFSSELAFFIRWPKYWSFSFSIFLTVNIQGWFPLRLTSLISLQSRGFSGVFSSTTSRKHQFFGAQPKNYDSASHIRTWLLAKP